MRRDDDVVVALFGGGFCLGISKANSLHHCEARISIPLLLLFCTGTRKVIPYEKTVKVDCQCDRGKVTGYSVCKDFLSFPRILESQDLFSQLQWVSLLLTVSTQKLIFPLRQKGPSRKVMLLI